MRTIRIITALALCALFCAPIYAQKYTVRNSGNYEVVTLGVGADGTKIFKIYVTEKTERKAIPLAKKAAIEVCVFRGLPATSTVSATPALCSLSDEQKHAAFFEEFFAPGSENPSKEKVKGGFKFGLEVQVLYNNLRNDLQDAGVIRSLSSGF